MDRFNWIVYPDAKRKLDETGITKRIADAVKNYKISGFGYLSDRDVVNCVNDMIQEGLFKKIPKKERIPFQNALSHAFKNRQSSYWLVRRNGSECKEGVETEDFLILSGYRARSLLRKDEVFNYKKFGFSNIPEFVGAVGATIEAKAGHGIHKDGLEWETSKPDGRIITNVITGDPNCDLRIYQRDITVYKTIDPLNTCVSYRPETSNDRMVVAAYHSTESALLISILKYVKQIGIQPNVLKDNAKDTIEWAYSLGRGNATCAEHLSNDLHNNLLHFIWWKFPLAKLAENYKTIERSEDFLATQFEREYNIYIGPKNEFIISNEDKPSKNAIDLTKSVSFLPKEMDNVIKGLLYQAVKFLGRTSVHELISILEYRFSPNFEREQELHGIRSNTKSF